MASNKSNNPKNPPVLDENTSYENWIKALKLWQLITELKPEKQGPALVLSLSGKAREIVFELSVEEISGEGGVKKITDKLDKIYKKDTVDSAYEAFEAFIYFKREQNMEIINFITEFERRFNKAKLHGCELSPSILGFFLLNQAQLSDDHKKLIRATISKLDFDEVKTKLMKVFSSVESKSKSFDDINIKVEDLNLVEEDEDVFYGRYDSFRYGRGNQQRARGQRGSSYSNVYRGNNRNYHEYQRGRPQYRGKFSNESYERRSNFNRKRCSTCESTYHQVQDCPEKVYHCEYDDDTQHDIVLYQSNLITDNEFKAFVAESANSAILDCGATATVTGKVWFDSYLEGLCEQDIGKIQYSDSYSSFKFGSGQRFPSLFKAKIPAKVGSNSIYISTDVINSDIPLLMSKKSMKLADCEIIFAEDKVKMFGEVQDVMLTKSGHYALPLNNSKVVLNDLNHPKTKITLVVNGTDMEKLKVAKKLHAQFGHPTKAKLIKVVQRAGEEKDVELMKCIDKVYRECRICMEYQKPSPRPAVGLPHASKFNETVGMDLKFFDGKIILHMVDHLTRFSMAIICKSKEPQEILSAIIKGWIAIFGPPVKFLTDNGGEFANRLFLELAESMNVRVLNTAAESPWSNGLVERHNGVLAEMLHKVMAEKKFDIQTALAWCLQAKNSLTNVHGFSPIQLVLGYNPMLPNVFNNNPPAMEPRTGQDIVSDTLNCIQSARKAFIEAENSDRVKRALNHNIRPCNNTKFFCGDIVYYKRNDNRRWKGPGKVIGSDSSCVLIKHGAQYVRVHACRVMLDRLRNEETLNTRSQNNEAEETIASPMPQSPIPADELTDSSENSENEINDDDENQSESQLNQIQPEEIMPEITETNPTNETINKIKKNMNLLFQTNNGSWCEGEVIRRTGKVTGKYKDFWYVKDKKTGEIVEWDTKNDWQEWKPVETIETSPHTLCVDDQQMEVFHVDRIVEQDKSKEIELAKKTEVEKWVEENVFEEVQFKGQDLLTTTWVITSKVHDEKVITKARLVVRGYEEIEKNRSDSPTCSKDNIRMLLAVAVSKDWKVQSLDIKAAFLQGNPIERSVLIKPPKEFRKENIVWKLKKVVYGLTDASRSWYLRVLEVLSSLGMKESKCDKALFTWRKENLEGVVLLHVDDVLYFGSRNFITEVMDPFREIFKISREDSEIFKYVGINVQQEKDCILLDQKGYRDAMNENLLQLDAMKDKERIVSPEEKKKFKQGVGQLGWIASMTKPEASFMFCLLSTLQSQPQVKDFVKFKKAVRDLKNSNTWLKIIKLDLNIAKIVVFIDASFGNLKDGGSQLGYVILLCDHDGRCIPISWASKKIKRVARSTLTAETLAAVEAVDAAMNTKAIIEQVIEEVFPPIILYVDSKSICDTANTTNVLTEKRLMIDMAALREMVERNEVIIKWVSTEKQIANVLTKAGADRSKLTDVLSSGMLTDIVSAEH